MGVCVMQLSHSACLISFPRKPGFSYEPTILSSAGLLSRLAVEIRFLLKSFRSSWPAFKEDPLDFARTLLLSCFGDLPIIINLRRRAPFEDGRNRFYEKRQDRLRVPRTI